MSESEREREKRRESGRKRRDRGDDDPGGRKRRREQNEIKKASWRGAFFFGPRWGSHRVITQNEGAYMSNLYSARSSVSKFEST